MKKGFTLILVLVIAIGAKAWDNPFEDDSRMFNVGVVLGNYNQFGGSAYHLIVPPVFGAFDIQVGKKMGIGYLGVGGFAGFSMKKYSDPIYTSMRSDIDFGARATYHLDMLGLTGETFFTKVDLYAGLLAGIKFISQTSNPSNKNLFSPFTAESIYPQLIIGGRYLLVYDSGISLELLVPNGVMMVGYTRYF